ncbi:MAG: CDP-glycerol glycerophosphotransferase family protein [Lachnospiraceae bacterium]|nr:CDP-glycerol glycerophosphotransferase family protein [Lachnospiraceae bacterium]
MKEVGKAFFLHIVMPLVYRFWCLRRRVQAKVLFLEIRYDGLSENLELLKQNYDEAGYYITELFCLHTAEGGFGGYMKRCLSMAKALADARLVYVDESCDVLAGLPIRKQTAVIQCWHACGAFKRFGHGLPGRMKGEYYGPYKLVTVSGKKVVPCYEDAMNQKSGIVKALGISRTDVFFDRAFLQKAKENAQRLVPQAGNKKTILYAPTFRGNVGRAMAAPMPDLTQLKEKLGDDWMLLYRAHPAVAGKLSVQKGMEDFCVDVSKMGTTTEWMVFSDVCVTDYSSLIHEYSLLDKPIIFYVPDRDRYAEERGFYHTIEDLDVGPVCLDTQQLAEAVLAVAGGETVPGKIKDRLAGFRAQFMDGCDGNATQRIMEAAEKL